MKILMQMCLVGLVGIFLCSCQGKVASNEEGNALAVKYLNATFEGKYDEAFNSVSDDFFAMHSKEDWIEYHKTVQDIMGPIVSVKLSRSLVDDRFSGRFYVFQFSIKHDNGFTTETVTMLQKINSKDPLKVFGHKIESSKLKKLNSQF